MQKFDAPAPVAVLLNVSAGPVQVIAVDRTETVVEALLANASKSRDVKAAAQTSRSVIPSWAAVGADRLGG
ncbi:hypothetical protein [Streptomyces puniciscabiei]|uniref:hypothetical protein n=1 Tax=Streptomyces puniciscabiei TaxID=164348 RepID=UPI0037960FDD